MRQKRNRQRTFQDLRPNWSRAAELVKMDEILTRHPELDDLIAEDFQTPQNSNAGAPGMSTEQVLRCAIVKQLRQLSYRGLEDAIDDSERLRSFCRFGDQVIPRYSTLRDNIARIRPKTWEAIHRVLVGEAMEQKIERGHKVRIDTTGSETNIHYPTDSRLIEDCVRVATRILRTCRECFGPELVSFNDRSRRAKKRAFEIAQAKSTAKRLPLYRDLLSVGAEVQAQARAVRDRLSALSGSKSDLALLRAAAVDELDGVLEFFPRVLAQCHRRVLEGESVPAEEKVFSIFEPHTDILVKGSREPVFGHKVCLTGGSSNLIIDCHMERGNPADSELYLPALDRTSSILGVTPRQVAADDGFASNDNAAQARRRGVEDVVFGGKLKQEQTQWVRSRWVQKQLRKFRAGIEATISATKRAFGLDRCTWSGWDGFQGYVWASVIAWNLQVMARHLLS